ncbi:MAG: hypothetical protein ACYDAG_06140 [Chloroflexota bacterium]
MALVKGWASALVVVSVLLSLTACAGQGDVAHIRATIEKLNHEQEDAFASRNPSLMEDTSTAQNFATMVQANQGLVAQGVVGIRLLKLEWGPVKVLSANAAVATTWETWQTTYRNGQSTTSRDQNNYKLVKVGHSWKVDSDVNPQQPGAPAQPTPTARPSGS